MSHRPTLEHELRNALNSLVPQDIETTRFRERLDLALAVQPAQPSQAAPAAQEDGDELTLLSFDPPEPRRRRADLVAAAVVALSLAATIAVVFSVRSTDHTKPATPSTAQSTTVPAAIQAMLFPGSIVLDTYRGRGSETIAVPSWVIPAHFGYSAYGTCSGPGTLGISQQMITGPCQPAGGGFGTSGAVQDGKLVITADPATTWQITLAIAPDTQTNGSVQNPFDQDLLGPDSDVRRSGRGTGTVTFPGEIPAPSPGTSYRLRLVCHGSSVTLPGLKTSEASGLQTKTCFAGYEYVWTGIHLTTPAQIRVEAPPDTTWTIAIDSM